MPILKRAIRGLISAIEPAVYLVIFIGAAVCWHVFSLPNAETVFRWAEELLQQYGVLIVLIAAVGEGIVLANLYFPGSAVIVLSISLLRGRPVDAVLAVVAASGGFTVASLLNYALGRYALHSLVDRLGGRAWLRRAERFQARWGKWALFMSYAHPNLGAFFAVNAGKATYPLWTFALVVSSATLFWNLLWGLLAYNFASVARNLVTSVFLIGTFITVWFVASFLYGALRPAGMKDE
jgi:membrane protein DedA with SNARE-associated domain